MAKKKGKHSEFYERITGSIDAGVKSLREGRKLTVRTVEMPAPPPEMTARKIVALRTKQLNVSQQVFAQMLNVSVKTVQAWEQGDRKPDGAATRLLQVIQTQPDWLWATTR